MITNNYITNFLYDMEKAYLHISKKSGEFNRLISALYVIEIYNRNILWRIMEYFFCIYDVFVKKYITNYSIWRSQVKISMILDFYQVRYTLKNKYIYYSGISKRKLIFMLFHDNYVNVIKNAIALRFGNIDIDNLSYSELENIARYYSRNNEFSGKINYWIVLKHLYYNSFRKITNKRYLTIYPYEAENGA